MGWFKDSLEEDTSERYRQGTNPFYDRDGDLLRERIFYSRDVLFYYQMLLLVVFIISSIWHWTQRFMERKQGKRKKKRFAQNKIQPSGGRLWHRVYGFLMQQPGSECWGMMSFLTAYIILTVVFCFYDIKRFQLLVLGFRLGLMCSINMPFLYVLGAKYSLVQVLAGWSYEQVNVLHRWVGTICVVTVLGHTYIFLYYFYFNFLVHHVFAFTGMVAGVCFILIGITSIPYIRTKAYEVFYVVHIVGAIICLPALYLHFPTARTQALIATAALVYDRTMRVCCGYRLVSCTLRLAPGDTVIMQFDQENLKGLQWEPGTHIFVTVLGCRTFESHPFTISSSQRCNRSLDLIIRARDGFSKDLYNLCQTNPTMTEKWALLHGPYGIHPVGMPETDYRKKGEPSQSCDEATSLMSKPRRIVLVSGGAGVAFTYPLYLDYKLYNQQAVEDGLPEPYEIKFLWVIPYRDFSEWIEIDEGMDLWISREQGRPNITQLLDEKYVEDSQDCWIATCGPEILVKDIRNYVAKANSKGKTGITFHAEKFGW